MNEERFLLFYQAISVIEYILYAFTMATVFCSFSSGKQGEKAARKKAIFIFLIYTICYLPSLFPWFYGWMHIILVTGILILLSGFLDMERSFAFLQSALFFGIRNLTMMLTISIDHFTSKRFLQDADTLEMIYCRAALNHLLIEALQFLLFILLLHIAERQLKKGWAGLHIRELCYLLLTPVTGILFTNIIVRLLVIANEDTSFLLYEQYPAFIVIIPAIAILFYTGILAAITAYQRVIALQEDSKKYFVAEQQLYAMQERIREVEQFHDGIRRMKHEMKNHLTTIKGLAESGHYEDMETYIARMDDSMRVFELTVHTGNAVTDIIINDRKRAAAALGIEFECDFSFPPSESAGYNAYDIGIILNNLLQNALEACEKIQDGSKYICLSGRQKRKFFLIDIRNPFDGKILFDRNTALPVSTKQKDSRKAATPLHGIGLSNVKREAEKYRGTVDIQIKDSEFHVTVLLQEGGNNMNMGITDTSQRHSP